MNNDISFIVESAANGTSAETLRPMVEALTPRDRGSLKRACRVSLQACLGSDADLDTLRSELARGVGSSTFAADKGDYEWAHKHRDTVLIDALRGILAHPESASEVAALALAAVDESDEGYYSF